APRILTVVLVILIWVLLVVVIRLSLKPMRILTGLLEATLSGHRWIELVIGTAARSFLPEQTEPLPESLRTLPSAARSFTPGTIRFVIELVLLFYGWVCLWLIKAVGSIVNRLIVPLFCVGLTLVFLLVVTEYAAIYFALQYLDGGAFNDHLGRSFFGCWAYSLSVLMTSGMPDVIPQTSLAWFVYSAELCCTFLLISVLLTMFSTALGYHADSRS